ncbi:YraN family protein [Ketogulonicigenium vulgare]|uniref:YraN family protein n=1 Tax=Ketogulonicigenium vulgare TaxID=92945 RepID=UPI002359157F|nr:YraN family protein [Ketogulonicigenium vulgare]
MTDLRMTGGLRNHLQGAAAEAAVLRHYEALGASLLHSRWRGRAGEIDLILQQGDLTIFVEVKSAASFDRAAFSIQPGQAARILRAAEEFMAGRLADLRIDLALVDGQGHVHVIENAFFA